MKYDASGGEVLIVVYVSESGIRCWKDITSRPMLAHPLDMDLQVFIRTNFSVKPATYRQILAPWSWSASQPLLRKNQGE